MQFRFSRLASASLAALAFSTSAMAVPILSAGASAEVTGVSDAHLPSSNNASTYQGDSAAVNLPQGTASAYAFANAAGAYAVSTRASGQQAFSDADASFTYTLTNTSGVAQRYAMSFHIYGGYLSASAWEALGSTERLGASYKAEVTANKQSLFSSGIDILNLGGVITETATGLTLLDASDTTADGNYRWSATDIEVDLGVLAAGDSLDFTARVTTSSVADVGSHSCGIVYPPTLELALDSVAEPQNCFKGEASAFYGDPVDFANSPTQEQPGAFSITGTPVVNDVPEPGALALVGLALAGLALQRRRARG